MFNLSPKVVHLAMRYLSISALDIMAKSKSEPSGPNCPKASLIPTCELDALIALRLALKLDESQSWLYESQAIDSLTDVSGIDREYDCSVYQQLLDKIVGTVFSLDLIKPQQGLDVEVLRQEIDWLIQKKEIQMCQSLDWNLSQLTGFDFLQLVLKASNESYDFSRLVAQVESFVRRSILLRDTYFLLFEDFYFYLGSLKLLSIKKGWKSFFPDLVQLLAMNSIDLDYSRLDQTILLLLSGEEEHIPYLLADESIMNDTQNFNELSYVNDKLSVVSRDILKVCSGPALSSQDDFSLVAFSKLEANQNTPKSEQSEKS
jgi:hypothetical protein